MPEVQSRSRTPTRGGCRRRNHYQEGPGFLFVATQGGRPPEATHASTSGVASSGVVAAALRRWADGEPVGDDLPPSGCGRATLFRWRARFEAGGIEALVDDPGSAGRASCRRPSSGSSSRSAC